MKTTGKIELIVFIYTQLWIVPVSDVNQLSKLFYKFYFYNDTSQSTNYRK